MKKAFISGVTGQDGAWLAKYLLDLGYEVYGGYRRTSSLNTWRLDFLDVTNKIKLVEFDLLDYSNICNLVKTIQPDEFYNLAAQSFVGTSFKQPISTLQIDGMGVAFILDIIKTFSPQTKFYQASTSELYGQVREIPQTENTPFYPRSPYACAKAMAHYLSINYRESFNIFASCGILFNHESELRGLEFVTRKVTSHVATWSENRAGKVIQIGNIDAQRDWGYAKEYVEAMHAMLQHSVADTYVLATGKTTKIRTFIEMAFEVIDRTVRWEGEGDAEKGYDAKSGQLLVEVNPDFYRPAEVELLIGDPTKIKTVLGFEPKVDIAKLTEIMVLSDIDLLSKNKIM